MNWQIFEYNIYVSDFNSENIDKEMIIEPDQIDTECIK